METERKLKIILDPAHGSNVAGKCSPDKSHYEWMWSRQSCENIKQLIQEQGFTVYYSNESDIEIGLSKRVTIANSLCKGNESEFLFFSNHNNAAGSGAKWMTARGFEVFISDNASLNSKEFANLFISELKYAFPEVKNRGVKSYNYTVLYATKCPAVLSEWLFQDNESDLEMLKDPIINSKFEEVVVNSIIKFDTKIFG